jgi:hypothetical protein
MKIPKPTTVNTGEQHREYNRIDRFFKSITDEIKFPPNHPHIEKRVMGMWRLGNGMRVDEHIHMLLYKQRVIGAVIETRTESNYIHFDYFLNLPSKPL